MYVLLRADTVVSEGLTDCRLQIFDVLGVIAGLVDMSMKVYGFLYIVVCHLELCYPGSVF